MSIDVDRPLDRSELAELREFLGSTPEAMSFAEAEGLLTAMASAPTTIMPSTWQPLVLGEQAFESVEEAERVTGRVIRLFNQILKRLNAGKTRWASDFDQDVELREWCTGYLRGVRLDPQWTADEHDLALLLPIGVLAGEFDLVGEQDSDGKTIEDMGKHVERYRKELPSLLLSIHDHWTDWRKRLMAERSRPAAADRIGRNDPCPCGSGRKYKRCCLTD